MTLRRPGPPRLIGAGEIGSLLEPHVWVESLEWSLWGLHVTSWAHPPEGEITGAAALRAALFGATQDAIAAVEAAGFTHDKHPRTEITGDAVRDHDRVTLHTKAKLEMWLREAAPKGSKP